MRKGKKMKQSILLLALMVGFTMNANAKNDEANACGNHGNNCPSSPTGGNSSATGGNAIATSTGGSSKTEVKTSNTNLNVNGQEQGQGQAQKQTTENANNAKQDVKVEGDTYEAKKNPVNTAVAVSPAPSATCRSGGAGGLQLAGLGISLGGDRAVDTCEINEAARIASAIGDKEGAAYIMCQNKWAAVTPSCRAIAKKEADEKLAVSVSKSTSTVAYVKTVPEEEMK